MMLGIGGWGGSISVSAMRRWLEIDMINVGMYVYIEVCYFLLRRLANIAVCYTAP